jgi:5-methylcytosine-specific restriction enzyme B
VGVVSVLDLLPGAVRLGVDATQLDATARVSLGPALHVDEERLPPFDGSGAVTVALSDIPALDPDVLGSHEAFVRLAAPTPSPFARHHQPEILTAVAAQLDEPLPRPAAAQVRYWKVSPGEKGEMWEECRDGGFIAIGWDKLGDLTGIDHDEFKVRADALDASEQVWKFRNIEVGDRVVANAGTTRVLGIGTVTGAYYYGTGKKRAHRLPVRWDDTTERAVEMKGWRSTLIRLKQDTFSQVESAPPVGHATPRGTRGTSELRPLPDDAGPEGGIDFEGILSELSSKSLSFSAELVASYLLALQAKRFVLLTGISGTGKTRLAQEIARIFGPPMAPTPVMDDSFEITTKPSQRKYGRFVVPAELAQEFEALSDPDQKRIDLEVPGVPMASMAIHKNAQGGNLLYVLLSGQQRQWFQTNLQVGDRFLLARRTKGDREWLELRLPDTAQPARPPAGATYELIAVRPDWTDARALLGFHNPLTRIYLSTPALQVLLRAQAEVDATVTGEAPRPFFLVFDEMNLARVEHYFSDFLSAMESGESIHLHDDVEVEESQNIPRRMTIPRNVFVVGTVNVDETTYMFSPKVLDRSFVLEFNEVDLDGLGGTIRVEEPDSTPLALVRMQDGLKLRGPATDAEWQRFESALGGVTSSTLRKLHAALAIDNRHFGYRVAREVARFVDLAMEQTAGTPEAVHAALDVAVLAKILPKLHGSQAELEQTLKRLMSIAIDDRPEIDVFSVDGVLAPDANVSLPRTARKLWRMQRRLRAHGFVSFIE